MLSGLKNTWLGLLSLAAALAWTVPGWSAQAPEVPKTDDEKTWAAEDEQDQNAKEGDPTTYRSLTGKVLLAVTEVKPDQQGRIQSVDLGTFATADGTSYTLRVPNVHLFELLKRYADKTIRLNGRLRVNGRYFVVEGVEAGGQPAPVRIKRHGL